MPRILYTQSKRERKAIVRGKAAVRRSLIIPLWLLFSSAVSLGQPVYFDNLYGASMLAGEGLSRNATIEVNSEYLNWAYVYGQERPFLFRVDGQGGLLDSVSFDRPDTVALWSRNLVRVDDSLFVGGVWRKINTQPQDLQGDCGLIKFDITGQVIWEQHYGQSDRMEYPSSIIIDSDGSFIIVGILGIQSGSDIENDAYLLKLNSVGSFVWEKSFGGTQFDEGRTVVKTQDNGFLLLGSTRSFGAGQRDFYLVKTDAQGNEQWHETYGGSDMETGTSIIALSDGNYLLAGAQIIGGVDKGKLIKINETGDVIWQEEYLHPESTASEINRVIELSDGSIAGAGVADSPGEGNAGWLIKTDSEGNLLWQRKYNRNQYIDLFYSVLATDDGGFLLSGQAINEATNSQDAWLLKVDSIGCEFPNCTVGIEEEERTVMVDVWPNPCTEVLNIEKTLSSATLDISVFDINGKEILKQVQNDGRGTIDVSAWVDGMYILQGIDEKGRSFSVKVVKQ